MSDDAQLGQVDSGSVREGSAKAENTLESNGTVDDNFLAYIFFKYDMKNVNFKSIETGLKNGGWTGFEPGFVGLGQAKILLSILNIIIFLNKKF